MKKCPECGREYDLTMSFCLDDGAELLYGPASVDEPATAILSEPGAVATGFRNPSKQPSQRNSLIAGIVGIGLVTALGVGSYLYYGGGSTKQIESIAVMPFVNESGNADLEYLSDGMAETLISRVAVARSWCSSSFVCVSVQRKEPRCPNGRKGTECAGDT